MLCGLKSPQYRGVITLGPLMCLTEAIHVMLKGIYTFSWLLTKVAFAKRVIFACVFNFCEWFIKALLSVGVWHLLTLAEGLIHEY